MGNNGMNGQIVRFELTSSPILTKFSEIFRIYHLSQKTGHHVKAWLPIDNQGRWVTYEITCDMKNSDVVTILATKEQKVTKDPQGGAGEITVLLQLVKVVGRGKV